jgi:hypothetical protein
VEKREKVVIIHFTMNLADACARMPDRVVQLISTFAHPVHPCSIELRHAPCAGLARRGGAIWMGRLVPDRLGAGVRARTPGRVQADYEDIFNQYAECSRGGAQGFFDMLESHRRAQRT